MTPAGISLTRSAPDVAKQSLSSKGFMIASSRSNLCPLQRQIDGLSSDQFRSRNANAGAKAQDLRRNYGISGAAFFKHKAKFGGMNASNAKKLRALDGENNRLKRVRGAGTCPDPFLQTGRRTGAGPPDHTPEARSGHADPSRNDSAQQASTRLTERNKNG